MFNEKNIRALLTAVANQQRSVEQAIGTLALMPFESVDGVAIIDHQRVQRRGFPEVIYCQRKTPQQVAEIAERIALQEYALLGTRATPDHFAAAAARVPGLQYNASAAVLWLDREPQRPRSAGVMIVAAGTSDLPVSDEAAITLAQFGYAAERITDVGVAGLHRLLHHLPSLRRAKVIIVVAGMEGALPSVVAGLTAAPVIAVPTSVGYGASFGGLAALLGMLNSCSPGITVVNIDNGFGAAYAAASILRMSGPCQHEMPVGPGEQA